MAQLTQEEIQQIKELQSRYNQTIFELGSVEAQIVVFHENIEKLTEAKKGLVSDLKTVEQKESELVKSLQEKYGQGDINIETGEITPIQQ